MSSHRSRWCHHPSKVSPPRQPDPDDSASRWARAPSSLPASVATLKERRLRSRPDLGALLHRGIRCRRWFDPSGARSFLGLLHSRPHRPFPRRLVLLAGEPACSAHCPRAAYDVDFRGAAWGLPEGRLRAESVSALAVIKERSEAGLGGAFALPGPEIGRAHV